MTNQAFKQNEIEKMSRMSYLIPLGAIGSRAGALRSTYKGEIVCPFSYKQQQNGRYIVSYTYSPIYMKIKRERVRRSFWCNHEQIKDIKR